MANDGSQIRDVQDGFGTFVFGSNLAGLHGKGAALTARTYRGARQGKGLGPQGTSYALPTKSVNLKPLSLKEISNHVREFIAYAESRPQEVFQQTRVGCGLAGFKDSEIAPMFFAAPKNIILPGVWRQMREIDFSSVSVVAEQNATEAEIEKIIEDLIKTKANPVFSVMAGTVEERAISNLADRTAGMRIQCFSPNPALYKDFARASLELTMVWAASSIRLIGPENSNLLKRIRSLAVENGVPVIDDPTATQTMKAGPSLLNEDVMGEKTASKSLVLIYAGVGSRETPGPIMQQMQALAENFARRGFLLRSGAAVGADSAFERGCDEANGQKEIWLPWNGYEGRPRTGLLPTQDMMKIASRVHPAWTNLSQGAQKLHARNVGQVLGANCDVPADFLVCWTQDGCEKVSPAYTKTGGTRTAIALANEHNVPVFNLRNEFALQRLYEHLNGLELARPLDLSAHPSSISKTSASRQEPRDPLKTPGQQQLSF